MAADLSSYARDVLLRDGGSIHIRAIRPDDKERLLGHFRRLSARSVYFRFFQSKARITDEELRRFTELDFSRHIGLAATLTESGVERFIGVARAITSSPPQTTPRRAEVAFAVADEHQGRGIATVLLEELARLAAANGVTEFEADVLGENNRMLEVFAASGFQVSRSVEAGVFHLTFPTGETPELVRASFQRERKAAAASIRSLLEPRSVAVVGASRRESAVGHAVLANLRRCGFTGAIYPINPHVEEILGQRAFPSVSAVGQPVDLAVVAVPAAAVEGVVDDCAHAGVRGIVVLSSGFAEASPQGREAQRRLRDRVRASGMRLVGPNCLGVLNTDPRISLNATFAPKWPPGGSIGLMSQSGALGLAVLDLAEGRGIGLSSFVSVGNKADVSGNDLLAYWGEDPRTSVVVLYLESFGNPRKFARVAPEVARKKPIVAVKSGRSSAGARAASSHSASLASLDVAVDALFEQAGVLRTDTLQGLFDLLPLLSSQPTPAGSRVAVVTNAGGPGILFADACEANGLTLPELAPATLDRLRGFLPSQAGLANPIDMGAAASPEDYVRTIAAVGADPSVDSVVAMHIPTLVTRSEEIARAIADGARAVPAAKPFVVVFIAADGAPAAVHGGARGVLPVYGLPENAALALAAAGRRARWLARPAGEILELGSFEQASIRAVVDRVVAGAAGPIWLEPGDVATILRAAGIEMAAAELVAPEDAVAAAERLGYPLVAKIVSRDILHKTDVGGVILGLSSATAVEHAVTILVERAKSLEAKLDGILLQREVAGGVEALVGVTADPTFGPLLVCGLGGVQVELLRDVSFHLTPLSDVDAAEMVSKLRAAKLLDGYRGSAVADRGALESILRGVAAMVEVLPELVELDLNPVKVLPLGQGAVVVDARMRIAEKSGSR